MSDERSNEASGSSAAALLEDPWTIAAVALWIVNDHVLKGSAPGWLTGKLSDVAGLAAFPVILATTLELLGARSFGGLRTIDAAAVATAIAFAATKLAAPAAIVYAYAVGALQWPFHAAVALIGGGALPDVVRVAHVMDATDVLTVPAALFGPLAARLRS